MVVPEAYTCNNRLLHLLHLLCSPQSDGALEEVFTIQTCCADHALCTHHAHCTHCTYCTHLLPNKPLPEGALDVGLHDPEKDDANHNQVGVDAESRELGFWLQGQGIGGEGRGSDGVGWGRRGGE